MANFGRWRPWMALLFMGVGVLTWQWFLIAAGILFFTWSWKARPCILCRAGFCEQHHPE